MEQTDNVTSDKPQEGAWANAKGYPLKITFQVDKPVLVVFDASFEAPEEMPSQDGSGVYYRFDVKDGEGKDASFSTSAWTLINSLKSHEPLAGQSLIITKKNVKGKNMFYVQKPDTFNAPTPKNATSEGDSEQDIEDGVSEDGTM